MISEFDHPDHGWKWTPLEVEFINKRLSEKEAEIEQLQQRVAQQAMLIASLQYKTEQAAEIDRLKGSTGYNMMVDGVPIPDDVVKKALFLYMTNKPVQKPHESIHDPAEIRRVFELDDAEYPPPESGFMKL